MNRAGILSIAASIVSELESSEGEETDRIEEMLVNLSCISETKMTAYRAVAIQAQAQIEIIDKEIAALKRSKDRHNNTIARVHAAALEVVTAIDGAGAFKESGIAAVKVSRRACFPSDAARWPDEYKTETTSFKLDTVSMKKAIAGGLSLDGFSITERSYVKFDGVKPPKG